MQPNAFSQAVDETFPKLDEEIRTEIKNRVFEHVIEVLREKVYADNPGGQLKLLKSIDETDAIKSAEQYIKQIFEKFASLPQGEKKRINEELNEEVTRVMREFYNAYER